MASRSDVLINLLAYRPSGTGLSRYADLLLRSWPGDQAPLQLRLTASGRAELGRQGHPPRQRLPALPRLLQATDLLQHRPQISRLIQQADPCLVYAPFTQVLRTRRPIRQVITCHDLTPLHYPNSRRAYWHSRLVIAGHLRRADHIIAISTSVADSLIATGIDAARISVVPNGVLPCADPIAQPGSRDLLLIARHARNKHVELALQGFARFLQLQPHWDGQLIVVGRPDRRTRTIQTLQHELGLQQRVRFEHGLSDAALEQLFRRCFCLLSTSLMEGFDYPLLEAQARGLPTLASDIAVHREFHTDTSLLFAGDDRGASLAAALQQLASNHGTWQQLSQRGLQQAQRYSLDRQSRAIQDVLQAQRR